MSRRKASRYVTIEAESGDSEEYDSSAVSEDLTGTEVPVARVRSYRDIADELAERYAVESSAEDDLVESAADDSTEDVLEAVSQSRLLPNARSPLLFLVRCKPGRESAIAQQLVELCQSKNIDIFSVVFKESLRGFLYVEAFKKQAVEEALSSSSIKGVSRSRLSVVPLGEMVDSLVYRSSKGDLGISHAHDFARIRGGKYKGDLVQVLKSDEESVEVRCVPRLDPNNEHTAKRQRPPQRLFDVSDIPADRVIQRNGGYVFNRDFYKDGYLVKTVPWQSLDFDVEPSFEELERLGSTERLFRTGDVVLVKKGDLRGTLGKVRQVRGGVAEIESGDGSGDGKYEVPLEEIQRHCVVGSEVSYEDQNGVVLHVDAGTGTVVLGINGLTEELRCPIHRLKPPVAERAPTIGKMASRSTFATNIRAHKSVKARRDPLVFQPVIVEQGRWRGLQGVVKDVYRGTCRVQLDATSECVAVDVSSVRVLQRNVASSRSPLSAGAVPSSTQTPSAFQTPDYSGAANTPGYKTPGYKTPGYKTPSGAQTPALQTPGYYNTTPGYYNSTPGYSFSGSARGADAHQEAKGIQAEGGGLCAGALLLIGGRSARVLAFADNKFRLEDGRDIPAEAAVYCAPERYDQVVVMEGPLLGLEGSLVIFDGECGTVRTRNGESHEVKAQVLAKKATWI